MKISVMGIEYDQLLSGKVLAEMGNDVMHVSKDNKRIEILNEAFTTQKRQWSSNI